jgi:hypothetical protein
MTPEQTLIKDLHDLLEEVIQALITDKLPLVKRYVELEGRVKKFNEIPSDKPSLFETKKEPEPITKESLKQGALGNFDDIPEPPEPVKEKPIDRVDLPWEKGITAEGVKTDPHKEEAIKTLTGQPPTNAFPWDKQKQDEDSPF